MYRLRKQSLGEYTALGTWIHSAIMTLILSKNYSTITEHTTLGLKGGVSFLAFRSSQLIGEKNMWFLISFWKRKKKKKNMSDQITTFLYVSDTDAVNQHTYKVICAA